MIVMIIRTHLCSTRGHSAHPFKELAVSTKIFGALPGITTSRGDVFDVDDGGCLDHGKGRVPTPVVMDLRLIMMVDKERVRKMDPFLILGMKLK